MAEGLRRGLHFDQAEFDQRLERLRDRMAARRIEAMLLFAPESQYWLTGYDTFGYCFFQCLVVPAAGHADESLTLLTRSADLRQAMYTSIVEDVRVWKDGVDVDPSEDLVEILREKGLEGASLGVELDTHGLTAANFRRLAASLDGFARPTDASDVVSSLRLVKSPAELAYVRKAAEIGDACLEAALPHVAPGANDAFVLAAMQGECLARGGDYPANPFINGSGPVAPGEVTGAHLCRTFSGRRIMAAGDQLTLEWAGVYRQYHAALMRTLVLGPLGDAHKRMFDAARDALLACEDAMKPGAPMADVFTAHAETLDRAGYGHARLNACGYSLGASYAPVWMEREMFYEGARTVMRENMVFFAHMILMDERSGAAMCLGRTSIIGADRAEPLSRLPLEPIDV